VPRSAPVATRGAEAIVRPLGREDERLGQHVAQQRAPIVDRLGQQVAPARHVRQDRRFNRPPLTNSSIHIIRLALSGPHLNRRCIQFPL